MGPFKGSLSEYRFCRLGAAKMALLTDMGIKRYI
jgi:hypothetical protein